MDARNVPIDNSYRWFFCAIEISKNYYSLFLGCGLLAALSVAAVGWIPLLGGIAAGVLSLCYSLGLLRLVKQVFTTGKATFDDFLKYTFDAAYFEKFLPLFAILIGMNLLAWVFSYLRIPFVTYPWSALAQLALLVCSHTAYMVLLNPSLTWRAALGNVLRGSWMNAVPLFLAFIFMIVFACGSLIMCLVGFFLYFIPMTVPVNYLIFSSIYEGLDVERTAAEWSSKSNSVQTISVPADEP